MKPLQMTIMISGRQGVGKTTLAEFIAEHLRSEGKIVEIREGDEPPNLVRETDVLIYTQHCGLAGKE